MTEHSDIEREERFEWLRKQSEPMDDETIELLLLDLEQHLFKCNRICNALLNRPKGLHEGIIQSLGNIKSELSAIRWYREQKNAEKLGLGEIIHHAHTLAQHHFEDGDDLGDTARRLLLLLSDAP